jgi:hypothetical protein
MHIFGLLFFINTIWAFCPSIVKIKLDWDYCVMITDGLPQNKTIYVDDCHGDDVCDFRGRPNKYVWPMTQTDLNTNSANYKVKYNNGGTPNFGYLEGFCKSAKALILSIRLHGEKCDGDSD